MIFHSSLVMSSNIRIVSKLYIQCGGKSFRKLEIIIDESLSSAILANLRKYQLLIVRPIYLTVGISISCMRYKSGQKIFYEIFKRRLPATGVLQWNKSSVIQRAQTVHLQGEWHGWTA